MKLIVGLGNPSFRYRNTRHNIGFLVVKEISKKFGIPVRKRRYKGLLGKGSINGKKVSLFMPQTYMNLSGEAVEEIIKAEKINPKDFLIICDDINLRFGFTRLRKKGSSGGHNGLESVIRCHKSNEFSRLRIGIGKNHKVSDVVNFVLSPFDHEEKLCLKGIIEEARKCVVAWVEEGPDKAMTRFNKRDYAGEHG